MNDLIRVMAFVVKVSNVVLGPHFKNQNFPGSKNCELTLITYNLHSVDLNLSIVVCCINSILHVKICQNDFATKQSTWRHLR